MVHTIGISDMCVSSNTSDTLITYSLGSCIGVTLYDAVSRTGGMIHCLLPSAKTNPEKAETMPCMFTDVGMITLLKSLQKMGAHKGNLVAKVAGCAAPLEVQKSFKIGERNHTILRKILWKNDILIAAEDVGGTKPRTLTLDISTGRTTVRSNGREVVL